MALVHRRPKAIEIKKDGSLHKKDKEETTEIVDLRESKDNVSLVSRVLSPSTVRDVTTAGHNIAAELTAHSPSRVENGGDFQSGKKNIASMNVKIQNLNRLRKPNVIRKPVHTPEKQYLQLTNNDIG